MSWMAQEGDAIDQPRRQGAHPNARAGQGCPWAQDSDSDQFKRGPPSSKGAYGNPINHTGYGQAPPPSRSSKKPSGRQSDGMPPWALDERPANHFAAPVNTYGAGLSGASPRLARPTSARDGYSQQQQQQQQQAPQGYPQYAQPIDDEDDGAYGYGDMTPQEQEEYEQYMRMQMQQQQQPETHIPVKPSKPADAGAPWAQTYNNTMQTESRAMYQGATSQPAQVLKPRGQPPRINNENYNLLHDSTGTGGYQKDVESRMQRDAILNQGFQAVADSRAAAQAIKKKMKQGDNVISWN